MAEYNRQSQEENSKNILEVLGNKKRYYSNHLPLREKKKCCYKLFSIHFLLENVMTLETLDLYALRELHMNC